MKRIANKRGKQRKFWSYDEDLKLKKALTEGGFPLAEKRLTRRTKYGIYARVKHLGLSLDTLGPIATVTAADLSLALDIATTSARTIMHADPLHISRGSGHILLPECRLKAMIALRAKPLSNLHDGLRFLDTKEAAARLGVSAVHFKNAIGPKKFADVRVLVQGGTWKHKQYLYPLEALLAYKQAN